jgi:hypothetical protein
MRFALIRLIVAAALLLPVTGCAMDDGYASWSRGERTVTPLKKDPYKTGGDHAGSGRSAGASL